MPEVPLKAPFPYFGGKSRAAHLVWGAFGHDIQNYCEPFAGSLAVLLAREPRPDGRFGIETVNDVDCYVANFWRAISAAPADVARFADWPVNEIDLHARHRWLVAQGLFRERMREDPDFFDARIAGWWAWGISAWIGGGWCSIGTATSDEKRRPSLDRGGRGAHSQWQPAPMLRGSRGAAGSGVHASGLLMPMKTAIGQRGSGVHRQGGLLGWMLRLQERLRRVRVCVGDFERVLGRSATTSIGPTGVLLDPPYDFATGRAKRLYAQDTAGLGKRARKWALEHGDDPKMRIALCGYEGEHRMPKSWQCVAWKANGGYAAAGGNPENSLRERIWFSPHCAKAKAQGELSL